MYLKLPITVYAELDGHWSMVVAITEAGEVILDRNGLEVRLPAVNVLKRNLMWPNGRHIDMRAFHNL